MGDSSSPPSSVLEGPWWDSVRDSVSHFASDAATSVEDAAGKLEPWQLALVVVALAVASLGFMWCLLSCICSGICSCCQRIFCCILHCCCKTCWYVSSCKCCRGRRDKWGNSSRGNEYMGI
eukprot:GHVS01007099.1.p1 GENE.GHVS01007099.1~~GHVS01007099.1.p1  ORF type:complete len:121 (+),score=20.85 GHVS01007099.1:455-817(+)